MSQKKKLFLNAWTSKDYKNILMVRHLRSFLIETMLRGFKFTDGESLLVMILNTKNKDKGGNPPYYRARLREKDLVFNTIEMDLKEKTDDDIFNKDFLLSKEQNNIVDTIENEITKTIKGFAWVMVNTTNKSNIDFIIRDDFKGFGLKDSCFNLNFSLNLMEMILNSTLDSILRLGKMINNCLTKQIT